MWPVIAKFVKGKDYQELMKVKISMLEAILEQVIESSLLK